MHFFVTRSSIIRSYSIYWQNGWGWYDLCKISAICIQPSVFCKYYYYNFNKLLFIFLHFQFGNISSMMMIFVVYGKISCELIWNSTFQSSQDQIKYFYTGQTGSLLSSGGNIFFVLWVFFFGREFFVSSKTDLANF